jgi:8-oxo-dGTP pyrophosphatase MutT (NUDIX family)
MSEELVDLRNAAGKVVRGGVERSELDQNPAEFRDQGLYLAIVIVVVFDRAGNVIGQRRAAHKSQPNHWDHVCGGILSGETPESAAVRETKEEIGCQAEALRLVARHVNGYGRYCFVFSAATADQPAAQDMAEVAEVWAQTPEAWRKLEAAGKTPFVADFFAELEAALNPE